MSDRQHINEKRMYKFQPNMDLQIYPVKPRRHWISRLLFDMMDLWNFTYRHNEKQMITPHAFSLPFGGKLNREKRGCKLAAGML